MLSELYTKFYLAHTYSAGIEEGCIQKRRQKGRRCCLGNSIYLIPCRISYFTFEEKDELHQDYMKKSINSSYSSNRPGTK